MIGSDWTERGEARDDSAGDDRNGRIAELSRQIAEITAVRPASPRGQVSRTSASADGGSGRPDPIEAKARDICLRLLTVSARPRAGLAAALRKREIPDEVAERVLDRLTEVGLVDDAAYAMAYVRTKHRDRGLGRSALRAELKRQGVDRESYGEAVDQLDAGDERARAAELVAKRLPAMLPAGRLAAKRRLLGQLARRGYPSDLAAGVIEEALANTPFDS